MNILTPTADPAWKAAQAAATEGLVDLRSLWSMFRRRLVLFLAICGVVLAATVVLTSTLTPVYSATSTVLLDPRQRDAGVSITAALSGMPETSSAVVDTEVQLLQSRELATRVVRALNLTQDSEFNPNLIPSDGGILSGWKAWLGNLVAASEPAALEQAEATPMDPEELAANILLERVSVRRRGVTFVLDITVTSSDAETATRVANAYADQYLVDQLEAKFEATDRTNTWLAERLSGLQQEVEEKELAVESFRASAGLLNTMEGGQTLTEQQIGNLNAQAIIYRTEYAAAQARLDTARAQAAAGEVEQIGEVLGSQVISELRAQRSEVARQRAELESRYQDRHPEVINIRRQLADIDSEIQAEANRIIASLESEANAARQRLSTIEGQVGALRGELSSNNQSSVQLRQLERDAEASRTLYETFLNRFEESSEEETMQQPDARIISKATKPLTAAFPNWKLNIALGVALAILAGVTCTFLAEAFDRGLSTSNDVETMLGVTALGQMPRVPRAYRARVADYVIDKPFSGYAEGLRSLRAAIAPIQGRETGTAIMFTSALPGEGKTATVLSLGRVAAMSGSKTIVVDTDTRRRSLTLGGHLDPQFGLMEVLAGETTLEEAVVQEQRTGLYILPLSASDKVKSEQLGRPEMRELLERLRKEYESVFLDTAPVLAVSEAKFLAPMVDQVVLLARWRRTSRDLVRSAWTNLGQVNAPVVGIALTDVNLAAAAKDGYGYGYGGKYYKSYSSYHAG